MIWFTSDLHFNHKNVIEYCNRPFKSLEEMETSLIVNWNWDVREGDTVFVLGDFCFGGAKLATSILSRLGGHKVLVTGNHDWKNKPHKWKRLGFQECYEPKDNPRVILEGLRLTLSHFPYRAISHDKRNYEEYQPEDKGDWLLHGHVHHHWKIRDRMINVGVDAWDYKPVSLDEIKHIIAEENKKNANVG